MAENTHYPYVGKKSDTDGNLSVWAGDVPGSLTDWLGETTLTQTELGYLHDDNSSGVYFEEVYNPPSGPFFAGGVLAGFSISDSNISNLAFCLKGTNVGTGAIWVYNFNTSSFDLKETFAVRGPPGDWNPNPVTFNINTNISNYFDVMILWALVALTAANGSYAQINFARIITTYSEASFVPYPHPRGLCGGHSVLRGGLI